MQIAATPCPSVRGARVTREPGISMWERTQANLEIPGSRFGRPGMTVGEVP
jgi:hypothetical protein